MALYNTLASGRANILQIQTGDMTPNQNVPLDTLPVEPRKLPDIQSGPNIFTYLR